MSVNGLRPYPDYRDSGTDWLGEVPEHWEVRRLKTLCDMRSGDAITAMSISEVGKYPVFGGNGIRGYAARYTHDGNFVLIGRQGALCGNVHIARGRFWASEHAVVATLPCEHILEWFGALLEIMNLNQYSFAAAQPGLSVDRVLNLWVSVPPAQEQTAIARVLNDADRRIRRYIRAKERLVELLEEQKQAIIHQAVTGQIDVRTGQPYPAYKDSEVEWLGNIPAHWEQCRLRNVVSRVTTGSRGWSRYAADTGPLFVRVANLSRGSLEMRFDDIVRLELPSTSTSEAARTRIKETDLLLSVTAYIGSVAVAPEGFEEAYVSQHVARCEPSPRVSAKWLGYVLLSRLGQVHGQMSLYGGTKDGLSLHDVKNYPIVMPPRDEQDRMVRWIERELSLLGELRDRVKRKIELVSAYRARLIADVVTGKFDVREATGTQ